MFLEERRIQILNILNDEKSTTISRLAEYFDVSGSTIRRDLNLLEEAGFIKRSHGGALLTEHYQNEFDFRKKQTNHFDQKNEIAKYAASLVENRDIIALNSSTITTLMTNYLDVDRLTIVTNSVNILNALSNRSHSYQVILLGGVYITKAQSLEGQITADQIRKMHFNKMFFGVNGIDTRIGMTSSSDLESLSKIAMLGQTDKAYCLAENAKFDRPSVFKVASFQDIDAIITDQEVENEILQKYRKLCHVTVVGKD